MKRSDKRSNKKKLEQKYKKYTCPDCGRKHFNDGHPQKVKELKLEIIKLVEQANRPETDQRVALELSRQAKLTGDLLNSLLNSGHSN